RLSLTENVPSTDNSVKLLTEKDFSIQQFYQKVVQNSGKSEIFLHCRDAKRMLERIASELKLIEAAGGLVKNAAGDYLFIYRRGVWDLPKGKIDEGERPEAAAVREVEEECGVQIDSLEDLISVTYHIYATKKHVVFKKTYWYAMSVADVPELIPQTEEEITDARWLSPDNLQEVKANTYPLILDLITENILS
ncbi:MAG: hypothetical protein RI924_246, partial [Bacteroidota bacterium]